ncbi:hypothetical protein [Muriicola soli]|uniref:DUF4369 domain-containing protein n=1 Tax=Muriicola soli TaxID=2507538 RepID=A0A411ED09_9FLAO|nr:hypothetical protein [Muriicola soli]QBA65320.1 hypothetical protein EQY75_12740 [Muriicola soli]
MMRVFRIITLVICLTLVLSCSKEEDLQLTSFQGIVLIDGTTELFTNGQIEIIGSELGKYGNFRKSFPIGSDGTFNIEVETKKIHNFQINLESPDYDTIYQSCTGSGITGFCTLMEPGKAHTNIQVFAQIIDGE